MISSTPLEKENLEAHVDLCALRYEQMNGKLEEIDVQFNKIDKRFDAIDSKIENIERDLKKGNSAILVALIGATATIIAAFVGVIVIML
jgi:tetrahydromethanopterin S-methyltransferase subunit G